MKRMEERMLPITFKDASGRLGKIIAIAARSKGSRVYTVQYGADPAVEVVGAATRPDWVKNVVREVVQKKAKPANAEIKS